MKSIFISHVRSSFKRRRELACLIFAEVSFSAAIGLLVSIAPLFLFMAGMVVSVSVESQPLIDEGALSYWRSHFERELDSSFNRMAVDIAILVSALGAYCVKRLRKRLYTISTSGIPLVAREARPRMRRRIVVLAALALAACGGALSYLFVQDELGDMPTPYLFIALFVCIVSVHAIYEESVRLYMVSVQGGVDTGSSAPVNLNAVALDVLYLRSFEEDDKAIEAVNIVPFHHSIDRAALRWVKRRFQVAALRNSTFPPVRGVRQIDANAENWKLLVEKLLGRAKVVVVLLGATASLRWEIQQVAARGFLSKTVILLAPLEGVDNAHRFREQVLETVREFIPPILVMAFADVALAMESEASEQTPVAVVFDELVPRIVRAKHPSVMGYQQLCDDLVGEVIDKNAWKY